MINVMKTNQSVLVALCFALSNITRVGDRVRRTSGNLSSSPDCDWLKVDLGIDCDWLKVVSTGVIDWLVVPPIGVSVECRKDLARDEVLMHASATVPEETAFE